MERTRYHYLGGAVLALGFVSIGVRPALAFCPVGPYYVACLYQEQAQINAQRMQMEQAREAAIRQAEEQARIAQENAARQAAAEQARAAQENAARQAAAERARAAQENAARQAAAERARVEQENATRHPVQPIGPARPGGTGPMQTQHPTTVAGSPPRNTLHPSPAGPGTAAPSHPQSYPAHGSGGTTFVYHGHNNPAVHAQPFHYPAGTHYERFARGDRLPRELLRAAYAITEWLQFGLAPPPPGYEWVRYGSDMLMVDPDDGLVADTAYGAFEDETATTAALPPGSADDVPNSANGPNVVYPNEAAAAPQQEAAPAPQQGTPPAHQSAPIVRAASPGPALARSETPLDRTNCTKIAGPDQNLHTYCLQMLDQPSGNARWVRVD